MVGAAFEAGYAIIKRVLFPAWRNRQKSASLKMFKGNDRIKKQIGNPGEVVVR